MSKIAVGKLTRRLFTLIALLACLALVTASPTSKTIVTARAQSSGYQLGGTVTYNVYEAYVQNAPILITKWNGSSWDFHGYAYTNSCGGFTYDPGGPGQYQASVAGYYATTAYCGGGSGYYQYVYGSSYTVELTSAYPSAFMLITARN